MIVTILTGLPGCGKSTYTRKYPDAVVVSVDDFFVGDDGVYRHDLTKLPLAHQDCWRLFFFAVRAHTGHIIVDNTNLSTAEIAPYVLPAEAMGFTVEIVTLEVPVEVCKARNVHNVPEDVMDMMAVNLANRVLPPWWKHTIVPFVPVVDASSLDV